MEGMFILSRKGGLCDKRLILVGESRLSKQGRSRERCRTRQPNEHLFVRRVVFNPPLKTDPVGICEVGRA